MQRLQYTRTHGAILVALWTWEQEEHMCSIEKESGYQEFN